MSSGLASPGWYALYVRHNCERTVAAHLHEHGQDTFLPTYKKAAQGAHDSSREAPLFPGYVFCRFNWERGPKLYLIPGVIRAVGMGKTPLLIENDEIEAIRRVAESRTESAPCPFGTPGTPVRVVKGPLAGIEGVVEKPFARQIVISVSLLRRSVSVKVDPEWLVVLADRTNANAPRRVSAVAEATLVESAMVASGASGEPLTRELKV